MERYCLPLAYTDRFFGCNAFPGVVFPTLSEGKQGKLSFFQRIFTPSDVFALKMAGNIV